MRKEIRILTCLLLLLSFFAGCGKQKPAPNNIVAYINGEAITAREIDYFKTRDRADIINAFSEQYGVTDFSDFWDRDFDGTTPTQALEEKAFEDACDAKIRLVLMREKGVYEDISFEGLEAKALAYNDAHKNQKNTVGVQSIDMQQFYTYYISTGEMTLKNILGEGELKPTDAQIRAYIAQKGEMTEQGAISYLVDAKYAEHVQSLLEQATVTMEE